jgi:hypothetical protein
LRIGTYILAAGGAEKSKKKSLGGARMKLWTSSV